MKKIIALLLTAALVLSLGLCAGAEASTRPDTITTSVEDMDTTAYGGGTWWIVYNDLFRFCVPIDWTEYDVTDEEADAGVVLEVGAEDGSIGAILYYFPDDSAYAANFVDDDAAYATAEDQGVEMYSLMFNDEIYGYGYQIESTETVYYVIPLTSGACYVLTVTPVTSGDDSEAIATAVMYSISLPVEE